MHSGWLLSKSLGMRRVCCRRLISASTCGSLCRWLALRRASKWALLRGTQRYAWLRGFLKMGNLSVWTSTETLWMWGYHLWSRRESAIESTSGLGREWKVSTRYLALRVNKARTILLTSMLTNQTIQTTLRDCSSF